MKFLGLELVMGLALLCLAGLLVEGGASIYRAAAAPAP